MKDIDTIEKALESQAAPKPRRALNPNFTETVISELRQNPKPKRRPWWQHYVPFHKPAVALAACAAVIILSGTAYATTDGFTKLPSFLNIRQANEQVLPSGEKIISVDTQGCHIVQWDETARKLTATDRTFLYRLKPSATITPDQVTQMVQGKCEFEAQTSTSTRQSALATYLAAHPADKDTLVGGYASEIITAITPTTLSTHGESQYNGSIKKYDLTFTHIAPDVTVASAGSGTATWSDLRVGDSIAYVYRATGNALTHSETTPPWDINTNEATIMYVERNSENVRAYFDFTNHNGIDFEEVVPCEKGAGGYCAKYGPLAPPRTDLDNSPAAMAIQNAYMYLSNSSGTYLNETNPVAVQTLREKFLRSFSPELAQHIQASPNYNIALCGHAMTTFNTPQNAAQSGDNIVQDILFTDADGSSFTITLTASTKTNLITAIQCK